MKKTTLLFIMLLVGQLLAFGQYTIIPDDSLKKDLNSIHVSNIVPNLYSQESKNSERNGLKNDSDDTHLYSKVFDQDSFTMYPNPVRNTLYVTTDTKNSSIEIYNVTGKLLFNKSLEIGKTPISVNDLKAGVYLVKFSSGSNSLTKKLIVI